MNRTAQLDADSLYDFKNPVVRDLAWVMLSPSLVKQLNSPVSDFISDSYCERVYHASYQWLCELDSNPRPLNEFLSQRKSSRLGYYFEDLVAYWLKFKLCDGYFAAHVKVSASNRDLGEFDFLFFENNSCQHWETAVKFYLCWGDKEGKVTWYGPNANDTLEKKLNKLLSHQVRLSDLPESEKALSDIGIDATKISAHIFLKGYLFYPLGQMSPSVGSNVGGCSISSTHLKGWWSTVDKFNTRILASFSDKSLRWQQLPKRKWLAPRIYDSEEGEKLLKSDFELMQSLREHFRVSRESVLVAGYSTNSRGQWQEQTRGFVVNQSWPN